LGFEKKERKKERKKESGSLIEVLSQHLPGRVEEKHEKFQSGYRMTWPRF
jgi:hypothetical protein